MKPKSYFRNTLLASAICFSMAPVLTQAAELASNTAAPITALTIADGTSVWFDVPNLNAPVPLSTINGVVPPIGPLPGWAHAQYTFLKYDGTNVVEMVNADKVIGQLDLNSANATSTYYDNAAATTLNSNQTIGAIETTRDFIIANGATLRLERGGIMWHNNSHWVKNGTGGGFVTSGTGTLTLVANGNANDYQLNTIAIKDVAVGTPLKVIKTGKDPLRFNNIANTYTGGTWINNSRLSINNTGSLGTGTARVASDNSQLDVATGGTIINALELQGLGWAEGTEQRGSLRFEGNANMSGNVLINSATRITANTANSGTLSGTLTGTANLEIGIPVTAENLAGTVTLSGNASAYTGTATVSRGRLNVNNVFNGAVHVSDLGTFGGTSTLTHPAGLSVGDVTGGRIALSAASPLTVNGPVSFVGASKLTFIQAPVNGTYTLLNYTGALTGGANLSFDQANYRQTVVLDTSTSGVIKATVSGTAAPLVWAGTATPVQWDVNVTDNWLNGATPARFLIGDSVLFDDSATLTDLAILGNDIQPQSITFNNTTKNYTLAGFGNGIVGATGVTKNGTGTVTFGGQNNTFTGLVQINAGILKISNAEALGVNPAINIAAGGQFDFNGQQPSGVGRNYTWNIAGNGTDGLGAISNSGGGVNENSGIRNLVLTADASVNAVGRFDIGFTNNVGGTITGNNHTLTVNAPGGIGMRGNASGSPITYVIATGRTWAENSDNAFGGATGTVVVKSGARVGTYGARTMTTPVTIESGGALYIEGALAAGTWTAPVTLQGDSTFDTPAQALIVNGPVTGANLIKAGANNATIANPGYSGNTNVTAGILILGANNTANDASTVTIAAAAKLNLTHTAGDAVATLIIDTTTMPAGTYGATGSNATTIDDVHFLGTGRLVVGGGGGPYGAWATSLGVVGGPEGDDDNDGIRNGVEFIIGGNPKAPNDASIAPSSVTNPTSLVFTYRRTNLSAPTNPIVQYSNDLNPNTWKTAINGTDGVTIAVNTAADPNIVTVTIPRPALPTTKLFARLKLPQ